MSHAMTPALYGLLAEFETPTEFVVRRRRRRTRRAIARWTPTARFPIEEASEAIGFHKTPRAADRAAGRNPGRLFGATRCSTGSTSSPIR